MKKYNKLYGDLINKYINDEKFLDSNVNLYTRYGGLPIEKLSHEELLILTYKLMEDLGFTVRA